MDLFDLVRGGRDTVLVQKHILVQHEVLFQPFKGLLKSSLNAQQRNESVSESALSLKLGISRIPVVGHNEHEIPCYPKTLGQPPRDYVDQAQAAMEQFPFQLDCGEGRHGKVQ